MNTMNLVPTHQPRQRAHERSLDITMMASEDLEAWFTEAGLTVTEVTHCTSASCKVCFPANRPAIGVRAA